MKQMSTIKFPNQAEVYEIVDAAARLNINNKSNLGHTHERSEIVDFAHEHDERYYTETEIDERFLEVSANVDMLSDTIGEGYEVISNEELDLLFI